MHVNAELSPLYLAHLKIFSMESLIVKGLDAGTRKQIFHFLAL